MRAKALLTPFSKLPHLELTNKWTNEIRRDTFSNNSSFEMQANPVITLVPALTHGNGCENRCAHKRVLVLKAHGKTGELTECSSARRKSRGQESTKSTRAARTRVSQLDRASTLWNSFAIWILVQRDFHITQHTWLENVTKNKSLKIKSKSILKNSD